MQMSVRRMCMVGSCFVIAVLVVIRGMAVMFRRMLVVFGCFEMVLCCFFRHFPSPA
jgi:hypothetical protein